MSEEVKYDDYFRLLKDVEKCIANLDNTENFTQLCHKINTMSQSMDDTIPEMFQNTLAFSDTNLVILICKFDRTELLKYILSEETVLYNVSVRIGRNAIQPGDCDSSGHTAFYYAMQSHHTDLLQTLIEKWPVRLLIKNPELLDKILSTAYKEIKLRKIPISNVMSVYVEGIVVELRFFDRKITEKDTKKPNQGKKKRIFNPEPVQQRLDLVLEKIDFITSESAMVDHVFECALKQIAKSVHVLKRQLRPTYDRIPWEEIEFYLVAYMLCNEKSELKMFHGSVFQRSKILTILKKLKECLHIVKGKMSEFQGSFQFPKKKRPEMIAQIISTTPFSKEFYDEFEQIRDFFTLETINRYLSLASSANARDPRGQLVITRCLQVVGEHLKDTVESPKLSSRASDLLLSALPVATADVLKKLRDSLSHDDSLKARMEMEENGDSFFVQIQEDARNLLATVSTVVYDQKTSLIARLLEDILECGTLCEMRDVLGPCEVVALGADLEEQGCLTGGTEKLEGLLQQLRSEMRELANDEASLFAEIDSLIQQEKIKLKSARRDFVKGYAFLSITMQMVRYGGEVSAIKGYANQAHIFLTCPKDITSLKAILNPCKKLLRGAFSRLKNGDISVRIMYDILHVLQYEVDNVKWIQELRSQLMKDHAPIKKKKTGKPSYQYNDILDKKVKMLHEVLNSNRLNNNRIHETIFLYRKNHNLQALVEMLLLDIMSILQSNSRLSENPYFLDHDFPLLLGQNLRKHLAHENPIVRVLTNVDLDVLLTANAIANGVIEGCPDQTDKILKNEPLIVNAASKVDLDHIMVQQRLFDAFASGDILLMNNSLSEGPDIKGRDSSLRTVLHHAATAPNAEAVQLVVDEYDLDINTTEMQGRNALHIASEFGRVNTVQYLVDTLKMDANGVDNNGRTPLNFSAEKGHSGVVEALLLRGADASIVDKTGSTPLQLSVENNHLEVLKLLSRDETDVDMNGGFTALHVAARKGYSDIADYLLSCGADVDKRTDDGLTPLHSAALGGHVEVTQLLVTKGAEVNARGVRGETPLLHAAQNGHADVVGILLDHEVDLDPVEATTRATPLHTAAGYGHLEVVKMLVQRGAAMDARRLYGETALHQALLHGHVEVARFLVESGAPPDALDGEGLGPLHICATCGHEGLLRLLIDKGAEVEAASKERFTPLHLAAMYRHRSVALALLESGADPDARDDTGSTPLHLCAHIGSREVAEVLLADIRRDANVVNGAGVTPATAAAQRGDAEFLKLLVSKGARVDSQLMRSACFGGSLDAVRCLVDCGQGVDGPDGETSPLHEAVRGNHKEVIQLLMEKGADVAAKNPEGDTPLMSALKLNLKDIVLLLLPTTADQVDFEALRTAVFHGSDILNALLKESKFDFKRLSPKEAAVLLHTAVATGQKSVAETLLEKGIPVDACAGDNGATPLFVAATAGHLDVVKYLLSKNASADARRRDGATPLHPASLYGFEEIVEVLLKAGTDAGARDDQNRSAIEMAVLNGHLDVVQMLAEGIDINALGHRGLALLHVAAERGRLDAVKFLMSRKADARSCDSSGSMPIHLSAMQGQRDVVEYFLSNGFNSVDELSACGETQLHFAVYGNNLPMVRYLVEKGAGVDISDAFRSSPVHLSASMGHTEILRFLLDRGASYNSKNMRNMRPSEIANAYGREEIVKLLSKTDELFEALGRHDLQKAKEAIEGGAVVNAKNEFHVSPLHLIALNGDKDIAELLLQNQANPDAVNYNGFTPLHFAARYSFLDIALTLLKSGAAYNVRSVDGKTPLDITQRSSSVSDILSLVESFFRAVRNGDCGILERKNTKVDFMKAVLKTRNTERKTLLAVAIRNDYPRIETLKKVYENTFKDALPFDVTDQGKLEAFFVVVMENKSGEFGLDNPSALDMREEIALMFFRRQMFEPSLMELQNIYLKRRETVGMGMDQVMTLRNIALVLFNQCKYKPALEIYRQVYKKLEATLGENNIEVIETRSTIAMALDSLGELDEALTINLDVIEKLKEFKGVQFPLYFDVMKNTGTVLMHLKRYEEALQIFQNVYKEVENNSFIDHPKAFQVLHHVGTVFYELGNYKEALILYSKTLEKQMKYLGLNHIDTLKTYKSIGILFLTRGECLKSYKVFRIIIGPMAAILGQNHPEVNFIYRKLQFIEIQVDIKNSKDLNYLRTLLPNYKI